MPDITMCINDKCPSAKLCYRHEAKPNSGLQEYADFAPVKGEVACGEFIELAAAPTPPAQEAQPVGWLDSSDHFWDTEDEARKYGKTEHPRAVYTLPPDAARRISALEAERDKLRYALDPFRVAEWSPNGEIVGLLYEDFLRVLATFEREL